MKKAILLSIATLMSTFPAYADEMMAAATTGGVGDKGYFALGAGLVLGLAAMGGALGQGRVGGAAMDGIARNPQAGKDMFTPMIVAFALIESLVILSFLMAGFIQGKF